MTTQATAPTPTKKPLVPYLVLPEDGSEPYLQGSSCPQCKQNYVGARRFCAKCSYVGDLKPIKLSKEGTLHVWTIIYQSVPGIATPYIGAIVDLPEGVSVKGNIAGIEPKPENLKFGMKLRMRFEQMTTDREGNTLFGYVFEPA